MKLKTRIKALSAVDYAAGILFVVLFAYLLFALPRGMDSGAESFYYTWVQRQMQGDRLLVDEWHVAQLSSLFEYLPFWLYTAVTGGTEGLILAMRYWFLAVVMVLYWLCYARLRRYGWSGLLSVCLFCAYVPMTLKTLGYYSMSLHGLMVFCVLMFCGKAQKKAPLLIFAGVVFAAAVVTQPFLAFFYLLWCLLVLCRYLCRRKENGFLKSYDFILDSRVWRFITVGVLLSAAGFFAFLLSKSSLSAITANLPGLLSDQEYNLGVYGECNLINPEKLSDVLQFYGWPGFCLSAVLIVASLFWKRLRAAKRVRVWLFALACLSIAVIYLPTLKTILRLPPLGAAEYYFYHSLPVFFFGLLFYLLCRQKDQRIFAFWIVGFVSSVLIDFSSGSVLGFGAAVAVVEAVLMFRTLFGEVLADLREMRETKSGSAAKSGGLPSVVGVFTAVCFSCFVLWEGIGLYYVGFYQTVEKILNTSEDQDIGEVLARGPLKGIRTTARIKGIYETYLSDLDVIKANAEGPVYIAEKAPCFYLYLDLPYATYSTWHIKGDSEGRIMQYWTLHPEKKPDYIYVPLISADQYETISSYDENWPESKLEFIGSLCEYDMIQGQQGYILHVTKWKAETEWPAVEQCPENNHVHTHEHHS